jgi:hypothetical protein
MCTIAWSAARHEAEWHMVSAAGAHSKVWAQWAAAATIHTDLMRLLGLCHGGVSTLGQTTESLMRILQLNASDSFTLAPSCSASILVPRDHLRDSVAGPSPPQDAGGERRGNGSAVKADGGEGGGGSRQHSEKQETSGSHHNDSAHRARCNPAQRLALLHLTHELDSLLMNLKSSLAGATDLALAIAPQVCLVYRQYYIKGLTYWCSWLVVILLYTPYPQRNTAKAGERTDQNIRDLWMLTDTDQL